MASPATSELTVLSYGADTAVKAARRSGNVWWIPVNSNAIQRHFSVYANLAQNYAVLNKEHQSDIRVVISGIERGLPASSFERLRNLMGVNRTSLTDVLHIASRTLARRKTLKMDESERLFRLGSVFQRAIEVLGSREQAHRWFTSGQKALGGASPLEFCKTDPGVREVEDLLGRIEHGVFA